MTEGQELAIGYELFIREYCNGHWILPEDFEAISATTLESLLLRSLQILPAETTLLSFNLEQTQFIDPQYAEMVARVQAQTSIRLFAELTERNSPTVTADQLICASQYFKHLGLLVCVDDVGTGDNQTNLVLQLDDYVDEYKFALQNLRPFNDIKTVEPELNYWYELAASHHKVLAIEGVETAAELDFVQQYYPCDIIQGYYIGRPVKLFDPVAEKHEQR